MPPCSASPMRLLLRPLLCRSPAEVLTVGSVTSVEGFSELTRVVPDYVEIRDRNTDLRRPDGLHRGYVRICRRRRRAACAAIRHARERKLLRRHGRRAGSGTDVSRRRGPGAWTRRRGRCWDTTSGSSSSEEIHRSSGGPYGSTASSSRSSASCRRPSPASYQFVRIAFYAPLMMWPRLSADPEARPLDARVTRKLTIKGRLRARRHAIRSANRARADRQESRADVSRHQSEP